MIMLMLLSFNCVVNMYAEDHQVGMPLKNNERLFPELQAQTSGLLGVP